ncbi:MAG: DinB family protein [Planctomycetota bacterium]
MPTLMESICQEFEEEAEATRRVIEALPADQLDFKPHEKSMTAGKLAQHIVTVPAFMCDVMRAGEFKYDDMGDEPPALDSIDALLGALDAGLEAVRAAAADIDDVAAMAPWRLTKGGETLMEVPTLVVARSFMLNHLYHHRGQLTVYLRLMGVPVPSVYGPSADVNPFE